MMMKILLFSLLISPLFVFSQEKETIEEDEVFVIVEQMPEFPGGEKALFEFLGYHTRYPKEATEKGITGTVFVNFTVGKDGLIRNIKVQKSVHPLLDEEAIRIVGVMPLWKPGKQKGKPISVSYSLPFRFSIEDEVMDVKPTPSEVDKNTND